jgi:hypothetical protein
MFVRGGMRRRCAAVEWRGGWAGTVDKVVVFCEVHRVGRVVEDRGRRRMACGTPVSAGWKDAGSRDTASERACE